MINTYENKDNYIKAIGALLEKNYNRMKEVNDSYFMNQSFEALKAINYEDYKELTESYDHSYANPEYAVKAYGEYGQIVSAVYTDFRSTLSLAYKQDKTLFDQYIKFFNIISNNSLEKLQADYQAFKQDTLKLKLERDIRRKSSPLYNTGLENLDYSDLRYLFRSGQYITSNEIRTAEFLSSFDSEELNDLMEITAKAYVNGFKVDGKDMSLRNNVHVLYNVGQERMVKCLIEKFKDHDLNAFFGSSISTSANKQYQYDHRFDNGMYLDERYQSKYLEIYKEMIELHKEDTMNYSGIMYFDKFGESPFAPTSKETNISLSDAQTKVSQALQSQVRLINDSYYKGDETSFCIIAFPVPEIGENFEAIYQDTCFINKLSSEEYLPIQQEIINALDQSDYVHIKGKDQNKTNIKVMHQALKSPDKETNYYNCGADVNIPVGEVFTSPQLKGTEGLLHLDVVYLNKLKFIDLELEFKDGYVVNYTCKNFEKESENKAFIEENLLFPHKTLPLGEFAIGTNTLAYVVAEKYQITDILPILIVEKMGPHFAIGDTCYTFSEDLDVYNPDGKCIMSRDNEHSIIRKEDISKAYTNVHTDITLPYDSIQFIKGINKNEEFIIIEDGRFVLKGTEKLNEPFKKLSN